MGCVRKNKGVEEGVERENGFGVRDEGVGGGSGGFGS